MEIYNGGKSKMMNGIGAKTSSNKIFGMDSNLIKLFIVPLAVVVIFVITLVTIIIPRINDISTINSSIGDVNSQIKSVEEKKSYISSIDQNQLAKDASYLDSAVFQEKNSYLLVGVIRTIADKYNFQIKSFSITPISLKDDSGQALKVATTNVAVKMPINVILSGPSDKNIDLVKSLENSLPILFIDKFDITSQAGFSDLDLTISSYYIPNNQNFVSGNLNLSDLKPTKDETDLLAKISKFDKNSSVGTADATASSKSFIKYERATPFNQ
jgi:phage shock protein PspC (stress-responsive transcriptional regulator)